MLTRRYRVAVQGLENLPSQGGVLLLGNHISWVDWAMVQIASPRPVRFVMLKTVYQRWYLRWFFKALGCIPIERGKGAEQALADVAEQLNDGEVVCLFPEGAISRTGQLGNSAAATSAPVKGRIQTSKLCLSICAACGAASSPARPAS